MDVTIETHFLMFFSVTNSHIFGIEVIYCIFKINADNGGFP